MRYSESAARAREMIEKAIEDQKITRDEMDAILNLISEDGHIDEQVQAMLNQLQEMIENKSLRFGV